jgi:ABC-type glycerol-3-phosphate transport system substrate-binding protein
MRQAAMKMKLNHLYVTPLQVRIAAVFLLLSLFLQGCSGNGMKLPATDELVICVDAHFHRMLKSIIRDYSEVYPNVKITYEVVTREDSIFSPLIDDDYRYTTQRHLQTEIMSGSGPDLFILDSGYCGECFFADIYKAMKGGVFCDLLPLLRDAGISEEAFIKPVFDAGKLEGKQYAAPLEYQVQSILTIEASHQNMVPDQTGDTAATLDGIRTAMTIPGAGMPPSKEYWLTDFFINPYYYAAEPLVDYDAETAHIDTALTRDILETGKFAIDRMTQNESFSLPEMSAFESWFEYMHSERNIHLSPYFLNSVQYSAFTTLYGRIMIVDPIPSEGGNVCAVVSSFAGIRANSANKRNAVNMIKMLLSEEYQIKKNGSCFAYPCEGFPVRKGILAERLHALIPGDKTFSSTFFSQEKASLTNETIQDFLSIESRITTARFPTPYEVNDILARYYTGELDLETALLRMQEYWEISLSE